MKKSKLLITTALLSASSLLLASCGSNTDSETPTNETTDNSQEENGTDEKPAATGEAVTVGTTEVVTSLDPAGAYDNGSFNVMVQVYPFLLNSPYGTADVENDIAESAEFTSPTEYTVTLKPGLKFANGNDLTSSDVKFSFDRQTAIADPSGPSSLLANLDSVETPDDTTVVFKLKVENDQIFPQILMSPAAPIVDEEVFPADAILDDAAIVSATPFAGQYTISSFTKGDLLALAPNSDYQGLWGAPNNSGVNVKYFTDESNLRLAIENKAVDVATRSLSATDVADLTAADGLNVYHGPGGELRYFVFNFDTQPYGAKTPEADPAKALAVRQAAADLIDRQEISTEVFKDTYLPVYSVVPQGIPGAGEPLKELYGDGNGGPDADRATKRLADAGVETPVTLEFQYVQERYGAASTDEYNRIKTQLEAGGLFKVNLQSTEWGTYSQEFSQDAYPVFQLGWFPDYSDPDTYLTPFFLDGGFLNNHFSDETVNELLRNQISIADPAEREAALLEVQTKIAEQLPTIPVFQGAQVAVAVDGVKGVEDTLDGSFKFRFGALSK